MAEPLKISTSKYLKQGKVDIDGNVWSVVLPGAGTEMRFSQASRACRLAQARLLLLDEKIENGKITDSELDSYEEYSKKYEENERIIYGVFLEAFKDSTNDNSQVKKWIDDTPAHIIMMTFEDIRNQTNVVKEDKTDGKEKNS